jgi:hypothetical protein
MEFIERYDVTKCQYLASLNLKQMKPFIGQTAKNDDERRILLNKIQRFCKGIIEARGQMIRQYRYSLSTPLESGGRLFSGLSIQGLPKKIRGFLVRDSTVDIDMVNAHPTILRYICKKHHIHAAELSNYVSNRDEVLSQFDDRDKAKTQFLVAVNSDKEIRTTSSVLRKFDKEMKSIQTQLSQMTDYRNITNSVPDERGNFNGSAINRILCMYENKILQVAMSVLNKHSIEVFAPMFDGVLIYNSNWNSSILDEIRDTVGSEFPDLDMKWSIKEHDNDVQVPNGWSSDEAGGVEGYSQAFLTLMKPFEERRAKIIAKSKFIELTEDGSYILKTKADMVTCYENIWFKDTNGEQLSFINTWLKYPKMKTYEDIGIFPPGVACPQGWLNIWKPFPSQLMVASGDDVSEQVQLVLNHIAVLCNGAPEVTNFTCGWIGHALKYPGDKSVALVFISEEGAGKGTLIDGGDGRGMFARLFGRSSILSTSTPHRDVWGTFNGQMEHAYIVNLDELEKKQSVDAAGQIKKLITDGTLTINRKGVGQYEIKSYHRFIITTNKDDPICSGKGDRRFVVIRCSDEYAKLKPGNVHRTAEELAVRSEYFIKLRDALNNDDVIATLYKYFTELPNLDSFNSWPVPRTEHQQVLQEMNRSDVDQWFEWFISSTDQLPDTGMVSSSDLYESYKVWCTINRRECFNNNIQLIVKLRLLRCPGVTTGIKRRDGQYTKIDLTEARQYFGLVDGLVL